MWKLFMAVFLVADSFLFAKTWTQVLKGFDCYGENCDAYADSSNVMYPGEDWWKPTILFNDSTMVFRDLRRDYYRICPDSAICFALETGGCPLYEEADCVHSFFVYVGATDSTKAATDSLWIQKRTGFRFEDTLNLADTSLFVFLTDTVEYLNEFSSSLKKEFFWKSMENPLSRDTWYYSIRQVLDSIYFVYRKDTSYFAYCLFLQSSVCNSFLLQCTFQSDSLPYFPVFTLENYSYPIWFPYAISTTYPNRYAWSGDCVTEEKALELKESAAIPSRRLFPTKNFEGKSYQTNGRPDSGNHTGVVVESGKAKLQRKK